MEDKEILTKLRENNPFVSSASPQPWENKNPDLLQLSREASEDIEQLMRHKRREPSTPLAGLILGEAGAGKTHMLTRILRRLRGSSVKAVFVAVRTFRDSESVTKHLLDEIFISLKRIHSNGRTQFDVIMSDFVASYQEHQRQEDYSLDIRDQVAKDIPDLDRNFLRCLINYLSANDSATKNDLLEWLINGLDSEESIKLGLPVRDLSSMNDSRREQEAEKVLIALGHVLAYAKVLMVVCFDQMDSMKDKNLISAWGNIINLLMNDLSGILPLCFVRSEIWNDVFIPVLDDAVVQRLRNNQMIMRTCSLEQAKLLIRAKIQSVFGNESQEIFDWLINRMGSKLHDGYSPRYVIELVNHVITATGPINAENPTPPTTPPTSENEIINEIKKVYDDEYKKVQAEPDLWPPKLEHLTLAFETWLNAARKDLKITIIGKDLKTTRKYEAENFACVIIIPRGIKPFLVANSAMEYITNFLEKHKSSSCYYISEASLYKPTWKKFANLKKNFQDMGGHVLMLDNKTRVDWYALVSLIDRIDNGDVNLYLQNGNRTASLDDLKKFIRENIKLIDFNEAVNKVIDKEIELKFSADDVFTVLVEILNASSMKFSSVKKACELLAQRGINITEKKLISFLKREKTFKIYNKDSEDPVVTFS